MVAAVAVGARLVPPAREGAQGLARPRSPPTAEERAAVVVEAVAAVTPMGEVMTMMMMATMPFRGALRSHLADHLHPPLKQSGHSCERKRPTR